ncbi:MAG: thioredoxin family protein [Ignavibacteria bacterium]|nr:thioredoxin family protein [Ignavibacteria bacterium]
MKKISLLLLALYAFFAGFSGGEKNIDDFALKNVDGRLISLKDFPDAKGFVIIFTSNGCPFAKLYPQRMNELNLKYTPLGIPLIAVNSSDTLQFEENSFTQMAQTSKDGNFNFAYLSDADQIAAKNFGAKKTPQAFVVWKENNQWVIKYSGAIDDNGAEPQKVQNKFVENALNELLNGQEVKVKETKAIGCSIIYKK